MSLPETQLLVASELAADEKLLWLSKRRQDSRFHVIAGRISGSCTIGFVFVAIIFGLYLGYSSFNILHILLWMAALSALLYAVFFMVKNANAPQSSPFVYAVTNKRLVAIAKNGASQSVYGNPFFSLNVQPYGDYATIFLLGPGSDDEVFEFCLFGVEDYETLISILRQNFMDVREICHEQNRSSS